MIEKIWSGESPLWRLLLPLSLVYGHLPTVVWPGEWRDPSLL